MKINEIFDSRQGEGWLMGTPATFIRTAGCNLRCPRCDTKKAQDPANALVPPLDLAWILGNTCQEELGTVVLTGGEPLLQPELLALLATATFRSKTKLLVETNGTLTPPDWIPRELLEDIFWQVSPKLPAFNPNYDMGEAPLEYFLHMRYTCWKFVVPAQGLQSSLVYLRDLLNSRLSSMYVILQPDGYLLNEFGLEGYLDFLKELGRKAQGFLRPGVAVLPQMHRILGWR